MNAVHTGEMYQIEHRLRMAGGAFRWHLSRWIPIQDPDGKVIRWYGAATDIEDQKQIEAKLRQSNQELEEFAFIASHDLQEPLRKIILFGNSLRDHVRLTADSQASDYLDRMQNMRQLFQNLIGNALKFHKPGVPPVVHVSGKVTRVQKTPVVEIRVADNGIGFEQQYAERIFQPFQQLQGRSQYEGTGLGLSICQRIIEHHHGSISVRSAPDDGSIFTIRLRRKLN